LWALWIIILNLSLGGSVYSEDINPWNLTIQERILTRKNISHLLIDPRKNEYRLVLITSERYPYNYKSQSFPLFFRLETEAEAMYLMNKMDKYLESGEAITIQLNGSEIKGVIFHNPYEYIP
jgi:hypothetical protein